MVWCEARSLIAACSDLCPHGPSDISKHSSRGPACPMAVWMVQLRAVGRPCPSASRLLSMGLVRGGRWTTAEGESMLQDTRCCQVQAGRCYRRVPFAHRRRRRRRDQKTRRPVNLRERKREREKEIDRGKQEKESPDHSEQRCSPTGTGRASLRSMVKVSHVRCLEFTQALRKKKGAYERRTEAKSDAEDDDDDDNDDSNSNVS